MSAVLHVNGWNVAEVNGEPTVKDTDLAERLGYSRPTTIRELIKRMIDNGQFGLSVPCGEVESTGGRPAYAFHLNEKQSLKVIAKSETETADRIMDEVIDVFLAYRSGKLQPNLTPMEVLAQITQRMVEVERSEKRVIALESRANRLENNIRRTLTDTNHFTIIGYANLNGINLDGLNTGSLGRKATKLSQEQDYIITSVPDSKYGKIGVYHKDIIAQLF